MFRQTQEFADGFRVHRPGFLGAAVEAFGAQQQHDGLQDHAQIGPLGRAHVVVDGAEQADRGAEELEVAFEPLEAGGFVFPGDVEPAVHEFADFEPAVAVGRLQFWWVDFVFRHFVEAFADLLLHQGFESGQSIAGDDVQMPGLQVASGWRPGRRFDYRSKRGFRHRGIQKVPHRAA